MPTTLSRVQAVQVMRDRGLVNVGLMYDAAETEGCDLAAACAMMEKETHGANLYGHDAIRNPDGSVRQWAMLSGFPEEPNADNFAAFWFMVKERGAVSNGVGPAQITSQGLLQDMMDVGLVPWRVVDNMRFGFRLLAGYRESLGSWEEAGTRYNGDTDYGADLAAKRRVWKQALAYA
jgi:hypothetical protein